MTPAQRDEVYAIVRAFNVYLPEGPLKHKMELVKKFEDQTYFAWIGKFGLGDAYYFRVHSPVTFCEASRKSSSRLALSAWLTYHLACSVRLPLRQ